VTVTPALTKLLTEARKPLPIGKGLTWYIESNDPEKTAGLLINQSGGLKEARAFLTKVGRERAKNPRGAPMAEGDAALLQLADVVQNMEGVSFTRAARKIALWAADGDEDAADNTLRRLQGRDKKRRLIARKARV
jgi:hypothetical protein